VTLTAGFPLQAAAITNLLEADQTDLPVEGQSVRFSVTPFQIVTLRLIPAEASR